MAALVDLTIAHRFQNGTAFLFGVRATGELAIIDVRLKLSEAVLQLLFENDLEFLQIHRRETRRICNQCAVIQLVDLHMAGRMTTAAQFLTDIAGVNGKALILRI